MQFKVGEVVVHSAHGVGKIVRLEEKRLGGQARLYYEVTTHTSTVWVPVDADEAYGLRSVTAKDELERCRGLLRSRPTSLNKDAHQRHLEIIGRLRQGSLQATCEVVRDLTARSWQKPLNEADSLSLRRAREGLCQEWAASGSMSLAEATGEVEALLSEARRAYAAAC